jgi:8-amino-7-oxononanoate synthase
MNNKIISIYDKKLLKITNQSQKRHIVTTIRKKDSVVTRNKKNLISFSCNDYLGLSQNKEVIEAGIKAIKKYGAGSGASRLVSGNNSLYEKLEYLLASFKNGEAACVFGSGYLTNTGVIPSLTTNKDLLIFDNSSQNDQNIFINQYLLVKK